MNPHPSRPEDRCRSGAEQAASPAGFAAGPCCFRSEGFAEDLPESDALRRDDSGAQGIGGWPGLGPVLGLALAGVLGMLGR
jgi:hypothetical protein